MWNHSTGQRPDTDLSSPTVFVGTTYVNPLRELETRRRETQFQGQHLALSIPIALSPALEHHCQSPIHTSLGARNDLVGRHGGCSYWPTRQEPIHFEEQGRTALPSPIDMTSQTSARLYSVIPDHPCGPYFNDHPRIAPYEVEEQRTSAPGWWYRSCEENVPSPRDGGDGFFLSNNAAHVQPIHYTSDEFVDPTLRDGGNTYAPSAPISSVASGPSAIPSTHNHQQDQLSLSTLAETSPPLSPQDDRSCDECGIRFQYPKDLKRHIRSCKHNQERLFECSNDGCEYNVKKFTRKDTCARHMKTCKHTEP